MIIFLETTRNHNNVKNIDIELSLLPVFSRTFLLYIYLMTSKVNLETLILVAGISAQKRRLKAAASRPVTREQRAELKQRKYRYLYQVRTAHGDVISQVLEARVRLLMV